jgi:hypothetical protein
MDRHQYKTPGMVANDVNIPGVEVDDVDDAKIPGVDMESDPTTNDNDHDISPPMENTPMMDTFKPNAEYYTQNQKHPSNKHQK